ncbi:MAG: hypothetical protein ACRDU4_10625 [Mycobacterium sp.]
MGGHGGLAGRAARRRGHAQPGEVGRGAELAAAREGAEKRWLYIDGIYIHYVLGYKLTDARWDEYQAEWGPSPYYDAVY